MKELSIKLSDYIEYKKPNYIFLKLEPSSSVRNYHSDGILSLVTTLYTSMSKQIKKINNKLFFECNAKISYYIYMEHDKVEFYFIAPETHYLLFKDKINDVWSNKITIYTVDSIPLFYNDYTAFNLSYKNEDAMSLVCDKRNNVLLSSLFTTVHIMEENDKLGIFYNFAPTRQRGWTAKYDKTIDKLQNCMNINRNKLSPIYLLSTASLIIAKVIDIVLDSITPSSKTPPEHKDIKDLSLSHGTHEKRNATIINTQIVCFSQSDDKFREYNNAVGVCQKFDCLDTEDNRLIFKQCGGKSLSKINVLDTKIKKLDVMKQQPKECQNYLSLPGDELLKEYPFIEHSSVQEIEAPKQLEKGVISLGSCVCKDIEKKVYLPYDLRLRCLALVILGSTRAGKSTYISNFANDARNAGECTIIFDFCANCELSDSVSRDVGNILNIDCSDLDNLQGLGYNEVVFENTNILKLYEIAKIKTSQLIALIDAVNADDKELKAKMGRYLKAAAIVVFVSNGSINDIFKVLQNQKLRYDYIRRIPSALIEYLEEHVESLKEIDERDKKTGEISGTKSNPALSGILDRVDQLKSNIYLELMLKKDCKNNFNLIEEMQKNQIICFRMPEIMFPSEADKDPYCTYWMGKIWLALKFRSAYIPKEKQVKVNIVIDELSQVPNCEELIRKNLSQISKFNGKVVISAHYLNQLVYLRKELKSASPTYMLLNGCDKENYKELQEEFGMHTLDDLLHLKRFHSLNLVKLDDDYASFITKLPPPLKPSKQQ